MRIHILTDNRTKRRGILAEHGLSVFIELNKTNILFDTGQTNVYCHNALQMNVDLNKTDYIVLSHGHYDHCGGLIHFPNEKRFPKVYIHEDALAKRYSVNPDGKSYREIGIPWSLGDNEHIKSNIVFNKKSLQIAPKINLYAEIPVNNVFEEVNRGFCIENGSEKCIDTMRDEQMLIFDTDHGLIVFLGCSHPGIINCLNYAVELYPDRKINTLVAGMHLDSVSPQRLKTTIQYLSDFEIQNVVPLHCTGIIPIAEMKRFLGNRCIPLCAGDMLEI